MATLYVMCGVPGSGKTTYCENELSDIIHVSRDDIRFRLLKPGESYFAHEKEVTDCFWSTINEYLNKGCDVIADQTSLTKGARKKLLTHITVPCEKIAVVMMTPLEVCKERNSQRVGARNVPESTLESMWEDFTIPTYEEGFDIIIMV